MHVWASAKSSSAALLSALRSRTYRRLFIAHVIALIGMGLVTVALELLACNLVGANAGAVLGTAMARITETTSTGWFGGAIHKAIEGSITILVVSIVPYSRKFLGAFRGFREDRLRYAPQSSCGK